MRTTSFLLVFITAIYLFYGMVVSQVSVSPVSPLKTPMKHRTFYDYKGVVNVHSNKGLGKGSIPEILKAAYDAQLDFIVFTESASYKTKIAPSRYEENILVLNGKEYSYLKSRLILIDPEFDFSNIKNAGDAHLFLSDYIETNRDGFVLLKHPTKEGYEWEGEFAKGIDGIEIISLRNHWRESWDKSKWGFITSLLMYPFNPEYSFLNIYQVPKRNLALWYKIAKQRKVVGLIGSDAKSKFKFIGDSYLKFPSYKQLFLISSNHLVLKSELTGQFIKDSKKVLDAVIKGQLYFALDFLGDSEGFNFYTKDGLLMGDTVNSKNDELCYSWPNNLPKKTWTKIFLDGKSIYDSRKRDLSCIEMEFNGAYNAIVYRKIKRPWPFSSLTVPWIYSNFIYKK